MIQDIFVDFYFPALFIKIWAIYNESEFLFTMFTFSKKKKNLMVGAMKNSF